LPASVCQGYASPALLGRFGGSGSERNDGDAEPLHASPPCRGRLLAKRVMRGGQDKLRDLNKHLPTRSLAGGQWPLLQITAVLCRGDLRSLDKPHLRVCREACPTLHLPLEGKVARRSRDGRGGLKSSCSTSTDAFQSAAWRAANGRPCDPLAYCANEEHEGEIYPAPTDCFSTLQVGPRQPPSNPFTQASRGNCICPGGLRCSRKHKKQAPRQRRGAGSRGSTPGGGQGLSPC